MSGSFPVELLDSSIPGTHRARGNGLLLRSPFSRRSEGHAADALLTRTRLIACGVDVTCLLATNWLVGRVAPVDSGRFLGPLDLIVHIGLASSWIRHRLGSTVSMISVWRLEQGWRGRRRFFKRPAVPARILGEYICGAHILACFANAPTPTHSETFEEPRGLLGDLLYTIRRWGLWRTADLDLLWRRNVPVPVPHGTTLALHQLRFIVAGRIEDLPLEGVMLVNHWPTALLRQVRGRERPM